ncbi:MAG TPA: transglycosylase SLT domain-containing protein [Candidatus Saccharimonadia bacterium]|jgi:hypothetical protein|nr:transglycosylase SLT domain-containing protein [Candidatus Saccharimonadia bacterium]
MAYSSSVEQWRSLVSRYFKPEDVDKALYVLQGESGGNPNAISNSGGYGLFQLNDGGLGEGLNTSQRLDPETNVRTAAQAVYGGSGWAPWGEGTYGQAPYDPKTGKGSFGVLGSKPYGGDSVPGATGSYDADIAYYWDLSDAAYAELDDYVSKSPNTIMRTDKGMEVYDPKTNEFTLDPVATRILERALNAEDAMDRLSKRKTAGIDGSGNDAATAYLNSEKEKAAEADRKYTNYVGRIKDLAAMEDLPTQRAIDMATALNAANEKRDRGTFNQLGSGMGLSGRKPKTDLSSFAASIKGTIPAEAPQPYNMNPAALEPLTPAGGGTYTPRATARDPQEVLASSGIAPTLAEDRLSPRQFNTGGGNIGGLTGGPSTFDYGLNDTPAPASRGLTSMEIYQLQRRGLAQGLSPTNNKNKMPSSMVDIRTRYKRSR